LGQDNKKHLSDPCLALTLEKMELIKRYKVLLILTVLALIAAAGVLLFIYHFHTSDVTALTDFSAAYDNFDQAVSDFSALVQAPNAAGAPTSDGLEQKADAALSDLQTKASARISSITKNDAELMRITSEIGNLAAKELDALKEYQREAAGNNAVPDTLAQAADFKYQRQTDYAHFRELLGQNE